ncbi:conserved hypothetical protein [Ricinus communis]|uniref:Neprosin PEP catalytic domain-containing protein n=1 Tax=Ricinus communis TaxID=3988 RepID=B9SPI5_RICCO|nr:conserved hypothetical protein [Ricinus communis]
MASTWWCSQISPIISFFVCFLLVLSLICPVYSSATGDNLPKNQTFRPQEELHKLKIIKERLKKINKPPVKTIQSPDGDLIDCVLPKGHNPKGMVSEDFQLWSISGETCPEGTVPIRRTKEEDMLRASSVRRFGRKLRRHVRRDTNSNGHEHAVGYVSGDQYYGAKASINVWAPRVSNQYEFSLSQMWVISGSFGDDLNTIEAGWQVSPELYGDNYPRFFTYWTVSIRNKSFGLCNSLFLVLPSSDPKHGNWWLEFGNGVLVGYWPSFLFTHLRDHASMVQFGGEVVNSRPSGFHTSTQMGSGHFAGEGFGKASYFRNLQVVDWDNNLIPLSNLRVLADHPNCYDIQGGINRVWGNYFYYGGPGRNVRCP